MTQRVKLLQALKQLLKQEGKTYADVAAAIDVSEATVKRLFHEKNMSLVRLEHICDWLQVDLATLFSELQKQQVLLSQLTLKQEQVLISNPKLLLVAYLVINHWQFDEIITQYAIDQHECIQLLATLDQLKIIELLPNNRIKRLTARNFEWLPDGPVKKYFHINVLPDFLNSSFDLGQESLHFAVGLLSKQSFTTVVEHLKAMLQQFDRSCGNDENIPLAKKDGYGMLLAIRHWELTVFSELRR